MRLLTFSFFTILIIVIDQITKALARNSLAVGESITVIPGMFDFTLVYNTGIAFGLFPNAGVWLAPIAIVVALIAGYAYVHAIAKDKMFSLAMILISAGALGNFIDRIFHHGKVTDFIDIRIIHVFNIADMSISIAVGLLLFRWMLELKTEIAKHKSTTESE